jgi:hypothetical protein
MRPVRIVIAALSVALGFRWHSRSVRSGWDATAIHAAQGVGLQLPNAAIFGRPTSEPIRPLRDKEADETEPVSILTDIRCGRYSAITALYPPEVSEAAAKMAVSSLYGSEKVMPSGAPLGMWRVESQRFSIMVGVEREGFNKGRVHVIFTHFIGGDPCLDFASAPPGK